MEAGLSIDHPLLREVSHCTVRIKIGDEIGTGFFVSPGLILTCRHVVNNASDEIPCEWYRDWPDRTRPEVPLKAKIDSISPEPGPDLALLRVIDFLGSVSWSEDEPVPVPKHGCVYLDPEVRLNDSLWTFGNSQDYPRGDCASFRLEGESRDANGILHLKTKEGQAISGFSGAAVLNLRTGGVCAIQRRSRDLRMDLGSRAIPISLAFEVFPGLRERHAKFHAVDERWRTLLDDRLPTSPPYVARLPSTGRDLFGRNEQLKALDDAWKSAAVNVFVIRAAGGIGKTSVINAWLASLAARRYPGAEHVYAWSFYHQGTSGEGVSSDEFLEDALGWFGDKNRNLGSPAEKAYRLAGLIRTRRTLLVLDGLEPLQFPPGPDEGRLRDTSVKLLVRELAAQNKGMCVITSRLPLTDIEEFHDKTVRTCLLERLSPEAGREVLRARGVLGSDRDLETVVAEFGGHALALRLLGTLLDEAFHGDVNCWREVGPLQSEERQGGHANRVMKSYEQWFGHGPELAVLQVLGLFDRPAPLVALDAVCALPPILGLTDTLVSLRPLRWNRTWNQLVSKLRRCGLLAESAVGEFDTLDTHPLVRQYFGQALRETHPDAWRQAHSRLFDYFSRVASEFPATMSEMSPLLVAMWHGCAAGRYRDALESVYRKRVLQGTTYYSTDALGAYGAGLAALSGFFDIPWQRTVPDLTLEDQATLLHEVGVHLAGVGRITESLEPFRLACQLSADRGAPEWGTTSARYLAEMSMALGEFDEALKWATEAERLNDLKPDPWEQMANGFMKGDVLFQMARFEEAEACFLAAEGVRDEQGNPIPNKFFFWALPYCEFLLERGRRAEAWARANAALETLIESSSLAVAQVHLALGRSSDSKTAALELLDTSVEKFREAHHQLHLPSGLLARADIRTSTGDHAGAELDLKESLAVAEYGRMRLRQADCYLGYARLHRSVGHIEAARDAARAAYDCICGTRYRRSGEIREVKASLS
jgi:tetratricopeptide (TPR) repeat protein